MYDISSEAPYDAVTTAIDFQRPGEIQYFGRPHAGIRLVRRRLDYSRRRGCMHPYRQSNDTALVKNRTPPAPLSTGLSIDDRVTGPAAKEK